MLSLYISFFVYQFARIAVINYTDGVKKRNYVFLHPEWDRKKEQAFDTKFSQSFEE